MKNRKNILWCFLLFSVVYCCAQNGKELFKNNCASCHSIGKGKLVGPDLKGACNRYSESWLTKWITSSQTMLRSGDTAAIARFNEYNKIPMIEFSFLPAQDIKSILAYIKTESEDRPALASSAQIPVIAEITKPREYMDMHVFYWYIAVTVIICSALFAGMGKVIHNLTDALQTEYKKNKK